MDKVESMDRVEVMCEMLKYRRPHRSKTERKFIQRFVTSLGGVTHDKFGNRYIRIGDAPVMYSCHTDSVHRKSGKQNIAISNVSFKLPSKNDSNCLGADNAAGLWLMREMILAKKPGLYIFHRGEEVGGLGSSFIAKKTPELVDGIKAAIAFDRRDKKSIITYQWGGRCCSDAFGESLANELKLGHKLDTGGSFTDTANYTDLIPECTNVSVGFSNEHSSSETLDMAYLMELRGAMLEYDWEKLVIKRKAGDYEPKTYTHYTGYNPTNGPYGKGNYKWNVERRDWDVYNNDIKQWEPEQKRNGRWAYNKNTHELYWHRDSDAQKPVGFLEDKRQSELLPDGYELEEHEKPGRREPKSDVNYRKDLESLLFLRLVRNNPSIIVSLLGDYGCTLDDLADYIAQADGDVPWQYYNQPALQAQKED